MNHKQIKEKMAVDNKNLKQIVQVLLSKPPFGKGGGLLEMCLT